MPPSFTVGLTPPHPPKPEVSGCNVCHQNLEKLYLQTHHRFGKCTKVLEKRGEFFKSFVGNPNGSAVGFAHA